MHTTHTFSSSTSTSTSRSTVLATRRTTRRSPGKRLSMLAATSGIGLAGSFASMGLGGHAASAIEGGTPNPTVSIITECKAGQYHFNLGLYNFQASAPAHFHVVAGGSGTASSTTDYDLAAGGVQWLDFIVSEGDMASFHVTSNDGAGVDELREPRADCLADPEGSIKLVCPADPGGQAILHYEWVNTSYTSAHFTLTKPDGSKQTSDVAWIDHEQALDVPVAEDSHATVSIRVDGDPLADLDADVDCEPDVQPTLPIPVTTTPVPDTTPASDPVTTPATDPATTQGVVPVSGSTAPQPPVTGSPTAVGGIEVEAPSTTRPGAQLPSALPSTGVSNTGLSIAALSFLLSGFGLVRLARRQRMI